MSERLPTMPMSMYSELLAVSLAIDEEAAGALTSPAGEEWLMEELLIARRHRQQAGRSGRADTSSRIAAELEYDRALVRLCRVHAIDSGPERFTRPLRERRRLEEALEALGVDVTGAVVRGERRHTVAGHEPPEGS